ncbi:hypothetical protein [Algoriphagus mannitolivorans]|uniref:hypothetical protein n=1 Tax=Algoriphagus mannitolivorans TaxID=226504 RepID=UPI0006885B0E|nr:hypothetical protein [Algoriphagus mannitolivorans]
MSDHLSHCRFSLYTREDAGRISYGLDCFDSSESEDLIRSKQPKIYVIQSKNDLLYVGYASQSLITRLKQGFRASGKNGYHGYKWKKLEKVDVHVFVFPILADTPAKESRLFFEAIEAELVFQIRTHTGKWPLYQNEIHFNNEFPEEAIRIAGELLVELR